MAVTQIIGWLPFFDITPHLTHTTFGGDELDKNAVRKTEFSF